MSNTYFSFTCVSTVVSLVLSILGSWARGSAAGVCGSQAEEQSHVGGTSVLPHILPLAALVSILLPWAACQGHGVDNEESHLIFSEVSLTCTHAVQESAAQSPKPSSSCALWLPALSLYLAATELLT